MSDTGVGDERTVVGQVTRGVAGQHRWTRVAEVQYLFAFGRFECVVFYMTAFGNSSAGVDIARNHSVLINKIKVFASFVYTALKYVQ